MTSFFKFMSLGLVMVFCMAHRIPIASSAEPHRAGHGVKTQNQKVPVADQLLKEVEAKYSKSKTVQMKVKKELELPLLKKIRKYEGQLFIKPRGKFKFELTKPSRSLVIVDGKQLWLVEYPVEPTVDNVVRVISSKDPQNMQSPVLVTFLLGRGSLLDHFKIEKKVVRDMLVEYDLKPKTADGDVKSLKMVLNSKEKLIDSIEFTDQIDNVSRFSFSSVEFNKKIADSAFKFIPPKGADVTEQ